MLRFQTFFEALLEVHFSEFFCLEVVVSTFSSWAPVFFFFQKKSYVKNAGGSVVETIEADRLLVSNQHINILLFPVFLASRESRLTV